MRIKSLVLVFWLGVSDQISGLEHLLPVITIYITISQIYWQRLACLSDESLILIRQQTPCHKNLFTSSSSVFSESVRGKSDLLNVFEGSKRGDFDLNKVEGNAVYRVQCILFGISLVTSGLVPSAFWGQIDGYMGFAFFVTSLPYVLKA